MYCPKCRLEIPDQYQTECPICSGPLVASEDAAVSPEDTFDLAGAEEESAFQLDDAEDEGLGLKPQQPEAAHEGFSDQEQGAGGQQEYELNLTNPLSQGAAAQQADEQAFEEFNSMDAQKIITKKQGSKSLTLVIVVVLLICALGGGGYYYFVMRKPALQPAAPIKEAQSQKQDKVLDKVLKKDKPASVAASKPAVDNMTKAAQVKEAVKPEQVAAKKEEAAPLAEPQHVAKAPAPVKPEPPAGAPAAKPTAPAAAPAAAPEPQQAGKAPAPVKPEPPAGAPAAKPTTPAAAPAAAPEPQQVAKAPAPVKPEPPAGAPAAKPASPAPVAAQPAATPAAPAKKAAEPEAVAEKKPAEKPAAKAGQTAYTVHTDSFRVQKHADAEALKLRKLGYDARVKEVDLKDKGVWYRVLIGIMPSRDEAQKTADELRQKRNKKDVRVIPNE